MTGGELAQVITSLATLVGVVGSVAVSLRNSRKLDEVHKSTNGLAARNEAMAQKLGIAEGTAVGLQQGREESK
jgi:hypothetical protein